MNVSPSIVGTWRLPSPLVEGEQEFMHIGKDGKMVHFLCIDPSTKRLAPVKHWAQSIGQDRYVVRTQPAHEGVEVSMMPTATGMMIDGPVARFDLVSVPETEIPEWYFPKLEKALTEMSLREMGINGLGTKADANRQTG